MKICIRCESQIPDHYSNCPVCKADNFKELQTKSNYKEYDEITGNELSILGVVHGDIDDIS